MSGASLVLRTIIKRELQNTSRNCGFSNINKRLTTKSSNAANQDSSINFNKQPELKDETEEEILDLYKERLKYSPLLEEQEPEEDRFIGLNLNHGLFGVFDIEDLVETLQHQQAEDIFVASVPKEIKYVDHMVIVSGRSQRHMQAIAQFVKRVFKHKRYSNEIVPKLEGENSSDWMALDMGNIALHIFSRKARLIYDLDSLWALGPKYDEEYNKKEPISSLLESHSFSLKGLEPAE